MSAQTAPLTEEELLTRAYSLSGKQVSQLATEIGISVPTNNVSSKGWLGTLLEQYLGANAGNAQIQDFANLKIELKSIPINFELTPYESTYICIVPLIGNTGSDFFSSNLYQKIKKILWVPFNGDKKIQLYEKIFFTPFIWEPDDSDISILKRDWEEHMEKIATGKINEITARDGQALQIRPKAANGKALTDAIGNDGQIIKTRPRGFYLRTSFTKKILQKKFFCY